MKTFFVLTTWSKILGDIYWRERERERERKRGVRHCVKSVGIRGLSGPHFPAFGLNMESYRASLRI